MAAICFNCGKGTMHGRSHTHHRGVAGGRWKKRAPKTNRVFKVNLQRVTVQVTDTALSIRLCTKCIKRIRKDTAEGKKPFLQLLQVPTTIAPSTIITPTTPPVSTA